MPRKVTRVNFKEGVSRQTLKSFDIDQPVLNTGMKISNISMIEESRGVLCQWTDHHNVTNYMLVPWGNIKDIWFDPVSMKEIPTTVTVKLETNPSPKTKN